MRGGESLAVGALVTVLAACGGGDGGSTPTPPPPPPPAAALDTLVVGGVPATFNVGQSAQLTVVSRTASGAQVSNPVLTWTTSAASVASVSPAGRVQAVAAGQAVIRVSGGGKATDVPLTVTAPPAIAVSLLPATIGLAPGATTQFVAGVLGPNGAIPDLPITWSSSDAAVATVDGTGRVTAVGPGRARITARYAGLTQESGVTVSTTTQNLRLAHADVIQVAQTEQSTIPAVKGKATALRLFPVAAQGGASGAAIDVTLTRNGAAVFATRVTTGALRTAFNPLLDGAAVLVPLPDGFDVDGTTLVATIDPDEAAAESDEWDNRFPLFRDAPVQLTALTLPPVQVRLVPMAPLGQALPQVNPGDVAQLVAFLNLIYPTATVQAELVGGLITSHADWNSDFGVSQAMNQLNARRTEDGSSAYYYGVTRSELINGAAGWGRQPGAVSMGWATATIVAHEVGHNFGLAHPTGCGNGTPGAPGAVIGIPGYDPRTRQEVPSSAVSVMSYCPGYEWIQPTAYLTILNARRQLTTLQAAAVEPPPGLLAAVVTGQLLGGGDVTVDAARPSIAPRGVSPRGGPVRVRFLDAAGAELFAWELAAAGVAREGGRAVALQGYAGVVPVPMPVAPMVAQVAVSAGGREVRRPLRLME